MKKIIVTLLIFLALAVPCFAETTFTEEEFYEVYDALQETTGLLTEANSTIENLQEQIKDLTESNTKLTEQAEYYKNKLGYYSDLLSKSETELNNSTKQIESLLNKNFLLSGGVLMPFDFNFGFKVGLGYKVWIGYLTGEFTWQKDKTFGLGLSYSIVF